jgi:hypothetical protein
MAKPISPTQQDRLMSQSGDSWYVRFPDGRIIRAATTANLRRHLRSGRVPYSSTVRRSPDDEWTTLEWTEEFADLVQSPVPVNGNSAAKPSPRKKKRRVVRSGELFSASARLDPRRLNLVGSRGIFREMLAALDGTLMPKKLNATLCAGLALGVLAALSRLPWPDLGIFQVGIGWGLAFLALVVLAALSSVLTRMTYLELSELRPARLRHGLAGAKRRTLRLLGALLFGLGGYVLLLAGLRWATAWLVAPVDLPWPLLREITANGFTAASLVLEFLFWPLFVLALLLAPILVVEEGSIFQALRMWRGLLRQHCRTVLAYEAVAVVIAVLIALPFAIPVILGSGLALDERLVIVAAATRAALLGFLAALPAAYLIVANVFIYLNVRYETGSEQVTTGS